MTFKKNFQKCSEIVFVLLFSSVVYAQSGEPKEFTLLNEDSVLLENFEQEEIGDMPANWFNRDGKRQPKYYDEEEKAPYKYQVLEEDGNKFLRYEGRAAKHINLPLKKSEHIDIYETPILSWRWRAWELPEGANVDKGSRNDAALSVYVVYKVSGFIIKKPKVIRYVWGNQQPLGRILDKGSQKIVVLQSGEENIGKWQSEERNIVEDYQRFFGEDPPHKPLAILILSDADNTKSLAQGDYDDFILSKKPSTLVVD